MVSTLFDLRVQGDKPMVANVDGSCEPNPGEGSCAVILRDGQGNQVRAEGFYLGPDCTNNTAEFEAVIRAAKSAIEHQASSLRILSDSQLAVMILTGRWKAKLSHLKSLRQQALEVLGGIPRWTIEWVPREQNVAADTVAGNARKFHCGVSYDLPVLEPKESDITSSGVLAAAGDFQHRGHRKRSYHKSGFSKKGQRESV